MVEDPDEYSDEALLDRVEVLEGQLALIELRL